MASTLEKIRLKAQDAKSKQAVSATGGQLFPIAKIVFDQTQPRQDFYPIDGQIQPEVQESLEDLAASMKAHGQQAEITLIEQEDGTYKIAVGERRVRAAILNGWTEIRAHLRNDLTGIKLKLYRLSENVDRSDLSELDTARYIADIVATGAMKKHELAAAFKKKPAWVTRYLAFADPQHYHKWVKPGYISKAWILYAVLQLPEDVQAQIFAMCKDRGSVELTSQELRRYEAMVKHGLPLSGVTEGESGMQSPSSSSAPAEDPQLAAARMLMKADTAEQKDDYSPPAAIVVKEREPSSTASGGPVTAAAADGNGAGTDSEGAASGGPESSALTSNIVTTQVSLAQLSAILVKLQKVKAPVSGTLQSLAVNFRLPESVIREALIALEEDVEGIPPMVLGLKFAEAGHKLMAKK
jgi:ParB/RepB/Spo0J family partition protein